MYCYSHTWKSWWREARWHQRRLQNLLIILSEIYPKFWKNLLKYRGNLLKFRGIYSSFEEICSKFLGTMRITQKSGNKNFLALPCVLERDGFDESWCIWFINFSRYTLIKLCGGWKGRGGGEGYWIYKVDFRRCKRWSNIDFKIS